MLRGSSRSEAHRSVAVAQLNDIPSIGTVRPFHVDVPTQTLSDLRHRLKSTRALGFPLEEPGLGVDCAALQRLMDYWRDDFNWRQVEAELNRFEHILVEVDGLDVHAVRARGQGPMPLPVLIGHGWPSTFAEVLPAIDLLTRPADFGSDPSDAFDVIVPSLPGYPFSSPPRELADASAARMARRFHGLMLALGYQSYGVSGGDIASRISAWMGAQQPHAVVGLHLTYNAITSPEANDAAPLSEEEQEWLRRESDWWDLEGGYAHIQRTKPRTAGIGLNDSPVGLAAWIVEKWAAWADDAEDPIARFGADQLLTHVMLHWITGNFGASMLTYTASGLAPGPRPPAGAVPGPAGFYLSEAEPHGIPPRSLADAQYNVARWSIVPRGGHFLPTEEPELFAGDLAEFFRPLRGGGPISPPG